MRTCNDDLFCKQNICLRKCCQEDEAWIGHQCQKLSSYHGHYRNFHTEIKKFIKNTYHNSILSDILNSTGNDIIYIDDSINHLFKILKQSIGYALGMQFLK